VNRGLVIFSLCACFAACRAFVTEDEVSRVTDPSGSVDAVLLERNAGMTVDFVYWAYVVKKGGSASQGTRVATWYGATRNAEAYGVTLRWKDSSTLELQYLSARRHALERGDVSIGGRTVAVVLKPGVKDNKAPPGGMLYNLQGRPNE